MTVEAPAKAEPGLRTSVRVKAPAGAKVQLLAVDEGILSLTAHQSPQPHKWLFSKRAFSGEFIDLFDSLFPDLGDQFGVVSLTGGGTAKASAYRGQTIKRIPAVYVSDFVKAGADGLAKFDFAVPQFNGQLRLMAVGSSKSATGSTQSDMLVRNKVTLQSNSLNVMAPGDEMQLKVILKNNEEEMQKGTLRLRTEGPLSLGESASREFELAAGESKDLQLAVKAAGLGEASVIMEMEKCDIDFD